MEMPVCCSPAEWGGLYATLRLHGLATKLLSFYAVRDTKGNIHVHCSFAAHDGSKCFELKDAGSNLAANDVSSHFTDLQAQK